MIGTMIFILLKWKNIWRNIVLSIAVKTQRAVTIKVLSIGVPTSLQMFFEVSAFAGAALIMGTLGAIPQAAHQIAINLSAMTFLTCTGIGLAATIRVGNRFGLKNKSGANEAGIAAILQVMLFMFVAAIVFVSCRNLLPKIYIDNAQVISIASTLLIMAAIFQISDGVQVVALGALRGIQDVKIPMIITFVAYWICGLPISYVSARYLDVGPVGVWLGLVLGLTISAIWLTRRFIILTKS